MHESFELIERARRRLKEHGLTCKVTGGAPDAAIDAAEEALACTFPPSYRAFLARVGAVTLPARVSTIQQFVGLAPGGGADETGTSVVDRTQTARLENKLGKSLVVIGLGADPGEWFCLDIDKTRTDGECPVMLFDARDNQLDQQFYDDFASMMREVFEFVLETLDAGVDLSATADDEPSEVRTSAPAAR